MTNENNPYAADVNRLQPRAQGQPVPPLTPPPNPLAPSEAESSTYFFTSYLTALAPNDWVVPRPGTQRGATAAIGVADPPFPDLTPFSGRGILSKSTDGAAGSPTSGPLWVMTDLATATVLQLQPAALTNANGTFVTPTPASMEAAVSTMKPDEHGLLLPDPPRPRRRRPRGASPHRTRSSRTR